MGRLGSEIARLRKDLGMTQKQLAKQVGVSESFILDVESGRKVLNSELITKINKALRLAVGKLDIFDENEQVQKPEPALNVEKVIEKPVQAVWNDALSGIIMKVPIYDLSLTKSSSTRQLPVLSNKVEGFPKDKVFYLDIADNDMIGFRICKGDIALAHSTIDFDKDGVFLIDYGNNRVIRQLKKLPGNKLLVTNNNGILKTLTVSKDEVRILAKLTRIEINL